MCPLLRRPMFELVAGDEVHLYVVPAANLLLLVTRTKRSLVDDKK